MANSEEEAVREFPSFLKARDPSVDRMYRVCPSSKRARLFGETAEEGSDNSTYENEELEFSDRESSTSNEATNLGKDDGAMVYLRLRPVDSTSTAYNISGNVLVAGPCSASSSTSNNVKLVEKQFVFSAIFDAAVGQREVYESCVGLKIDAEESFTLLAYGTSGSGKTYTLKGDDENPGIIPRSLENIFTLYKDVIYPFPSVKLVNGHIAINDDSAIAADNKLRSRVLSASSSFEAIAHHEGLQKCIFAEHDFKKKDLSDVSVMIWISFSEIYNECVYDLLVPPDINASTKIAVPPRCNLKIMCNDGKVFTKGLTTIHVKSSLEALQLLRYGNMRLNIASTAVNANSSRSHCIFTVDVLKYNRSGDIQHVSYKFCDLAGSERLVKTGNVGFRLKEAQSINSSLMVLGRCLDAANAHRKKSKEKIPFRDSKLTMLLQGALLGREKLSMIVNVTPNDKYYDENMNVLSFSSVAKNIIFKPAALPKNARYSLFTHSVLEVNSDYVKGLQEENLSLRLELERVKSTHRAELFKQEQELRNSIVDSFQTMLQERKNQYEILLKKEKDTLSKFYESKLAAQKRKHERHIEDLKEEFGNDVENEGKDNYNTNAAQATESVGLLQQKDGGEEKENKIKATESMDFQEELEKCNDEKEETEGTQTVVRKKLRTL